MQNLPTNRAMLPVRWMNANAQELGLTERGREQVIPSQAQCTAPGRPHTPDQASRLVDSCICVVSHGRYPGGIFKSKSPHRLLRLCAKQPRRRNETSGFHSTCAEFRDSLFQPPPCIDFAKVEKLALSSRVGLGHELLEKSIRDLFFPEVAPTMQNGLVPFLHPFPKPVGKGGIA